MLDVERTVAELAETALATTGQHAKIVAFVGPTATGKTELATLLAARVGGEIVSADSVQVYTRFDIGSGKPTAEELAMAPHHLVGLKDPHAPIDAAAYAALASRAIEDIRGRGKVPIVCGGTFLWVKALLHGLADAPEGNPEIRARHQVIVGSSGRAELHRMLAEVDASSAARLHPNDQVRVSRALEVFELRGETLSALQERHAFREVKHYALLVARQWTPDELTRRIEARVDGWLAAGWIEEVSALVEEGYGECRAMGSVGYRQVKGFLRGEMVRADLAGSIVRATRVFARRQRTWLNRVEVRWV